MYPLLLRTDWTVRHWSPQARRPRRWHHEQCHHYQFSRYRTSRTIGMWWCFCKCRLRSSLRKYDLGGSLHDANPHSNSPWSCLCASSCVLKTAAEQWLCRHLSMSCFSLICFSNLSFSRKFSPQSSWDSSEYENCRGEFPYGAQAHAVYRKVFFL